MMCELAGTPPTANFLIIVFEQFESVGVQAILDLSSYRAQVGVRRALASSPLVTMLRITQYPYVVSGKTGTAINLTPLSHIAGNVPTR